MKALALALAMVLSYGHAGELHKANLVNHRTPKPVIDATYIPVETYHIVWKHYTDPKHTWFLVMRKNWGSRDWVIDPYVDNLYTDGSQFYITLNSDGQQVRIITVGPQGVQEKTLP